MKPSIKTVIIEDEQAAVNRLRKELSKLDFIVFEIIAVLESVEASVDWLKLNQQVELIFMDIQLTDGLSFEIFRQQQVPCPVIFTTAFDEYAVQAFKVNSIDYLLKPIDPQDLSDAVNRYLKQQAESLEAIQLDQLVEFASRFKSQKYRSSFLVSFRQKMTMVDISEVAYLYIKERGVFLKKRMGWNTLLTSFLTTSKSSWTLTDFIVQTGSFWWQNPLFAK